MKIVRLIILCAMVCINGHSIGQFTCNLVSSYQQPVSNFYCGVVTPSTDAALKENRIMSYQIMQEQVDYFLRRCLQDEFAVYVACQGVHGTNQLVEHTEWWGYDVLKGNLYIR